MNLQTKRIISAVGEAGPRNVARLSRMTGIHPETVRYEVRRRFQRLGLKFYSEPDFTKLGLSLHWGTLTFSKTHRSDARKTLGDLGRNGLVRYARLVPQGNYACLSAIPRGATERYKELLFELERKGVLDSFTLRKVLANRRKTMDPQFFNPRSGRWEVRWDRVANQGPGPSFTSGEQVQKFGYLDLLIIKELQKDPLQHIVGMAHKLRINSKTIEYHYRTHVQGRKLVSLGVVWAPNDVRSTPVQLSFHDLTPSTSAEVQAAVGKVPFLSTEELTRTGYIATMYAPASEVVPVLDYVGSTVPNLASRVDVGFLDHAKTASFTIPYHLYHDGEWRLD